MFERISINDQSAQRKAYKTLKKGGVIAYPTDTIYGFGCDASNDDAIQRLNLIKQRQGPMSVLCPNIETGLSWIDILSNIKKNLLGSCLPSSMKPKVLFWVLSDVFFKNACISLSDLIDILT